MNKAGIFYIVVTYLLFLYGPWPYPVISSNLQIYFLLLVLLTFLLNSIIFNDLNYKIFSTSAIIKNFRYVFMLSICSLVLAMIEYLSVFTDILSSIFSGNFGETYLKMALTDTTYFKTPIYMFASVLVSPFQYIMLGCLFFYDLFPKKVRVYIVIFSILYILRFLIFGQLKGVIDVVGVFGLCLLRREGFRIYKLLFKPQVIFLSIVFGVIGFFIHTSRGYGLEYGTFGYPLFITTERPYFDNDSIFESFYIFYELVARYFGHGYYALSLAFTTDFKPDLISFSLFLNDNFRELNMDTNESLIKLLGDEHGWDYQKLWHTQFLWWISGFGFFGAIIIIFFQQFFILSLLSRASSKKINIIEIGILGALLINFIYMPLNNQIFYNLQGVFSIFVLTLLMIINRLSKN